MNRVFRAVKFFIEWSIFPEVRHSDGQADVGQFGGKTPAC
jgi:hypothetical protein